MKSPNHHITSRVIPKGENTRHRTGASGDHDQPAMLAARHGSERSVRFAVPGQCMQLWLRTAGLEIEHGGCRS